MSEKKKIDTEQAIEECEKILKAQGMSGMLIIADNEAGHFGLHMPDSSLFKLMEKDKLSLKAFGATPQQIEDEFVRLRMLIEMATELTDTVKAMGRLLKQKTTQAAADVWPTSQSPKDYAN